MVTEQKFQEAIKTALNQFEDTRSPDVLSLLSAVAHNPARKASSLFLPKLHHDSPEVRRVAALALGRIGVNDGLTLSRLERFYTSYGKADVADAEVAIKAISMLRTEDSARTLQGIIEESAAAPDGDQRFELAVSCIKEAGISMLTQLQPLRATSNKVPDSAQSRMSQLEETYQALLAEGQQLYASFVASGGHRDMQELGKELRIEAGIPKTFTDERGAMVEVLFDGHMTFESRYTAGSEAIKATRMIVLSNPGTARCLALMVHGITSTPQLESMVSLFPGLAKRSLKTVGVAPDSLSFGYILPESPGSPLGVVAGIEECEQGLGMRSELGPGLLARFAPTCASEVHAHLAALRASSSFDTYVTNAIQSEQRQRCIALEKLPKRREWPPRVGGTNPRAP